MADVTADRLPPLPEEQMTAEQQAAAAEISSGPRGAVIGPFAPLLRSPELMTRLQKVGEYLRFESPLDRRLFEMTILFVARWWDQQFEWTFHHPLALEAGLDPSVADAIAEDRRPDGMDTAAEAVWDLRDELYRTHRVSDAPYGRALGRRSRPTRDGSGTARPAGPRPPPPRCPCRPDGGPRRWRRRPTGPGRPRARAGGGTSTRTAGPTTGP